MFAGKARFKNKDRACASRRCRTARHTKKTSWAQGKGEDACASISITGFGNQYGLSALTRVSAVIVDENDTSAYLDKAAILIDLLIPIE